MDRSGSPRSNDQSRSSDPSRRRRSRRAVLRWCGLVGLSGVAGCTRNVGEELPPNEKVAVSKWRPDLPVTEKTDVLKAGITALSTEPIADEAAFEATLAGHDVTIASTERVLDILKATYVADRSWERGVLSDIGRIGGAYAALVDAGYDARRLELTVRQPTGSAYGAATIESKDAKRYNDGGLSASEYGELIAQSLESKRRA